MDKQAREMAWSSSKMHTSHYNLITDFKAGKQDGESQNYTKLSCFDPKCHAQVPERITQCKVEKSS